MSILVEALSVVIPRHVLDAGYPGGTEGYLETARRARGARYAISDDRLACVSFASPADADAFTLPLSALGLGSEEGAPPPVACLDEDFGPTAACPWLRWRRHDDGFTSCWLEWTEPGELAAPPDWLPPRQRSQAGRPAAARPASPPAEPAPTAADFAPATSAFGRDTPPPFRIVPTAIGPLTPISSPAVLAAMEGIPASNGHALLDADSMDVDSLVASGEATFPEMEYGNAGSDVADEEVGDEWSLPEFEPSEVDAQAVDGRTTTDETNETADGSGPAEEEVEDPSFAQDESAVVYSMPPHEAAATNDVVAMDDAYEAVLAEASTALDGVTAAESVAAEEAAADVQEVQTAEEPTVDAQVPLAEDDWISYDAMAGTSAAEISESEVTEVRIWSDEIDDEPMAPSNCEDLDASLRTDANAATFDDDDIEALFAARDRDLPASPHDEAQQVASALPDDDTAHIPASLTPVAMTAISVAPSPVAVSSDDSSLDAVRAHLAERGWRYSQDVDQGALFYQTVGGRASYPGFAAADKSEQLVWLYTQIPVRVPEHRRAAAVELLTRANHGLAVGNFEFDYTDGEVRFKAVADTADGCFTAAAAGRLLRHSLDACDRYHDSLMQVIYGGLSPSEAVR